MKLQRKILHILFTVFLLYPVSSVTAVSAQHPAMPFVMAYGSDLGELNPLTARSQRSAWYNMLVYDTLLLYDDELNLIPWLAESWIVSPDGLTINFSIRSGAVWHDGEPVTPNDVKFTFEYIRDGPSYLNMWSFFQNLTSVTLDGNVISCTFDKLYSFTVDGLGSTRILPEHVRNGTSASDTRWDDEHDIAAHTGSGPFKFVERTPDEYTLLERNDEWWGDDNPNVGQLPNIDSVRIDVVLGQDTRILTMRQGNADTERYEVFGPYVEEVLTYPELQLVQGVVSQWDYILGFNVTLPGLNDINVRRAMAMAVNRTELITVGRLGYGTRTDSAIPEAFYPRLYDADADFPDGDIVGANQLLDSAGYIDLDGDGTRNYPGDSETELEFTLLTLSWNDISVETGSGLADQMARINITINNQATDDGPMYEAIFTGAYEMFTMAYGYSPVPAHVWWRTHSVNIYDWGMNVFGFRNATVDTIMDDFLASTPLNLEDNARDAALAVLHNVPYVPLYLSDDTHILRREWVNYTTPAGGPFTSFNPRTMVFMYDDGTGITSGGGDMTLIIALGAGTFIMALVIVIIVKRH